MKKKLFSFVANQPIVVFLILAVCLFFAKGPIYATATLAAAVVFLFFIYDDLSIALFQTYLFTLVIGAPFLTLPHLLIQSQVLEKIAITSYLNVEIPYRFVVFSFFLLSLLLSIFSSQKKTIPKIPVVIGCLLFSLMFLVINLGQLFGKYPLVYQWPTFHLLQIFLIFPALIIFLQQKTSSIRNIDRIKKIFMGFVFFALIIEGFFSMVQVITRAPIETRIEKFFTVDMVKAPENNMFRSAGTVGHPNSLSIMMSTLIPISLFFLIGKLNRSKQEKTKELFFEKFSIFMGFVGLILSYSRWAWISFSIGIFFILLFNKKWAYRNIRILLLSGSLFLLLLISRFQRVATLSGRVNALDIYLKIIQSHPVWGVGPENSLVNLSAYGYDLNKYLYAVRGAHNTLLLVAADNGVIVGFLFLCIWILIICLAIYYLIKYKKKSLVRNFLIFFTSSLLISILNTFAYPIYTFDSNLEIFLLIFAFFLFSPELFS